MKLGGWHAEGFVKKKAKQYWPKLTGSLNAKQLSLLQESASIPWLTPPKQTPWQPWLRESPRPARAGAASRTHHHTLLGFPITDTATGSDEMWESIKN